MLGFAQVTGAHPHLQQVRRATAADDLLLARHQLARHQGEQVAGFFVRIDPQGVVAPFGQRALFHQVAVGEQHGVAGLVRAQQHAVAGHHIGAIQKVGDAPKAFSFALREEGAVADVQARQLGVFQRLAGGEDFQLERLGAFGQVL